MKEYSEEEGISHCLGPLEHLRPEEGKRGNTAGKRHPKAGQEIHHQRDPEIKSWKRSEETCIVNFSSWCNCQDFCLSPRIRKPQKRSMPGEENVLSGRFHRGHCVHNCTREASGEQWDQPASLTAFPFSTPQCPSKRHISEMLSILADAGNLNPNSVLEGNISDLLAMCMHY